MNGCRSLWWCARPCGRQLGRAPRRHVARIEPSQDRVSQGVRRDVRLERLDPFLGGVRQVVAQAGALDGVEEARAHCLELPAPVLDNVVGVASLVGKLERGAHCPVHGDLGAPLLPGPAHWVTFFTTLASTAGGRVARRSRPSRTAESFSTAAWFVSFVVDNNRSIISDHWTPDAAGLARGTINFARSAMRVEHRVADARPG